MKKIYDLVHLNGQTHMVENGRTVTIPNKGYFILDRKTICQYRGEFERYTTYLSEKILATTDPSLNLPLLPQIEEDVSLEALREGEKEYPYRDVNNDLALGGFIRGYKKRAVVKKYTEEDMFAFGTMCGIEKLRTTDQVKEALKLFNPLPKQVSIFVENDVPLQEGVYIKIDKWIYG